MNMDAVKAQQNLLKPGFDRQIVALVALYYHICLASNADRKIFIQSHIASHP